MLILAYSGFRFVYGTKATAAASTCICECVRAPICLCVRVYVCTEWAVWSAGSAMRQRACVQLVTMINLALIVAAAKSNKNKHYTMFKWVSCWRGLDRERERVGKLNAANNTKMHLQPGNSDWTLSCVGMPTLAVGCVYMCACGYSHLELMK